MDEKDKRIITFDIDSDEPAAPKAESEVSSSGFTMMPSEPAAPKTESEVASSGFTMTPGEPASLKADSEVAGAGFTMTPSEPATPKTESKVEGAGFTMTPSEPASRPESAVYNMSPGKSEDKAQNLKRDFDEIKTDVKVSMSQEAIGASKHDITKPAVPDRPEVRTSTTVSDGPVKASNSGSASGASSVSGSRTGGSHYAQNPSRTKKEKKYVTRGTLIACMILTMILSTILGSLLGTGLSGRSSNSDDNRAARKDSELSQLNLSDATGSELTVSEIVSKNADAVVEIIVSGTTQGMWGQMQLTEGAGSGVIIREDGYIATNYHVIQGANKVQVTLHNGDAYPAQIIGSDPANDVAVIKIDEKNLTTASIGDSSKVSVGDLAVAIGNPLGQLGGTATTGIISALDRTLSVEGTTLTLLQTDAAINGGNSGGGLFNSKGELIGIVESKAAAVGVEGLAFALPINSVAEILNDIIESGGNVNGQTAGTPAVGVVISDVSEEQSQYYGLDEPGVYIAQVTGVNAQQAGFKEQDRIVSFNGTKVEDSSTFITLVRKCKVGDTVTIVVSRGGQEIEIKTVLEELQTNQ